MITVHVANTVGTAMGVGVAFTLTINSVPVYKGPDPPAQTVDPGAAIATADFGAAYNNPAGAGSMAIDADNTSTLQVQYQKTSTSPFGTATTLQGASLHTGIAVSGATLTGSVPNSAPVGVYTLTAHVKNSIGPATGPAVWVLTVSGVPQWDETVDASPYRKILLAYFG